MGLGLRTERLGAEFGRVLLDRKRVLAAQQREDAFGLIAGYRQRILGRASAGQKCRDGERSEGATGGGVSIPSAGSSNFGKVGETGGVDLAVAGEGRAERKLI